MQFDPTQYTHKPALDDEISAEEINENMPPEGEEAPPIQPPPDRPKKDFRTGLRARLDKSDPRPSLRLPAADAEVTPLFKAMGELLKNKEIYTKNDAIACLQKADKIKLNFPSATALGEVIEAEIKLVKISKKKAKNEKGEEVEETVETKVSLPDRLANKALVSPALKNSLREIRTVEQVCLPVFRGENLEKLPPGYEVETGVFSANSIIYRTDMPFEDAKKWLENFFGEFPFGDERSKSVVIALAVSEFVKYLLPCGVLRPAIATQANAPGPGKTVALQMGLGAVHGFVGATGFPKNGEEIRKKIAGMFEVGDRILLFDNVENYCNSDVLCAVITSPIYKDRLLGVSGQSEWRHEAQVCISGNNLRLGPDMLGRTLVVNLRQTEERPALRRVRDPFSESMLARHRADYLAALWAITKKWIEKGRPEGIVWGRFEEWCKVVGGIVVAAGFADPCEIVSVAETNADGDDARVLVAAIAAGLSQNIPPARCQKTGVNPADIRKYVEEEELFDSRLAGCKSAQAAGSAVGLILREWTGRECGGWRLMNDGKPGKRRKYWVEKTA